MGDGEKLDKTVYLYMKRCKDIARSGNQMTKTPKSESRKYGGG